MDKLQVNRFNSVVCVLVLVFFMAFNPLKAQDEEKDVPYVPTPKPVVEKMLELAEVGHGDYVIDLGSGDGRIVIEAVRLGADGHGIEIDPEKISEAQTNAKRAGVARKVRFIEQDLFKADISRASVVTLYLLPSVNEELRPILFKQLEPGTKVVSHRFDMDAWKPDRKVTVKTGDNPPGFSYDKIPSFTPKKKTHEIFYWVIPADAEGSWKWSGDGHSFIMNVTQEFQDVVINVSRDGTGLQVDQPVLRGRRIRLNVETRNKEYLFNGRIEGDTIKGYMQIQGRGNNSVKLWKATR